MCHLENGSLEREPSLGGKSTMLVPQKPCAQHTMGAQEVLEILLAVEGVKGPGSLPITTTAHSGCCADS